MQASLISHRVSFRTCNGSDFLNKRTQSVAYPHKRTEFKRDHVQGFRTGHLRPCKTLVISGCSKAQDMHSPNNHPTQNQGTLSSTTEPQHTTLPRGLSLAALTMAVVATGVLVLGPEACWALGGRAPPPPPPPAVSPAMVNCAAAAAGILQNVRIPAMLLAGAAVGQLWTEFKDPERKPYEQTIFTLLVSSTVILQFLSVFIATALGVRLNDSGFNPMAANAVALLMRDFELPYLCVRWCFFTGFLAFTCSLVMRALATLPKQLARATALLYLSGIVSMISFFNYSLVNFPGGYLGVLWRILTLCLSHLDPSKPMAIIACACLLGALYYASQAFVPAKICQK